jgi:succinate-acetate transporter protein
MGVFSGFYIAYGILFMPSTGFVALVGAQADGAREIQKCAALFSLAYAVPAFLFFLATFKQPWLIRLLMVQVTLAYILSGVGNAMPSNTIIAAGGWFSITTGLTAWYMMAAMIYTNENTYFTLPVF